MKEHDYTPGPWHVSNEGKLVIRDDEWFVPVAIAGYATNDEELATAKLIAAAPELLEALQAAMDYIDAIPKNIELPAMPGFDRDWVDGVISNALGEY